MLTGKNGYLNGVEILNNTCNQLYGKGQYAESARSINAEDINELANYDPETYSGYGDLWKYRFPIDGEKIQYSKSTDNGKHGVNGKIQTIQQHLEFQVHQK